MVVWGGGFTWVKVGVHGSSQGSCKLKQVCQSNILHSIPLTKMLPRVSSKRVPRVSIARTGYCALNPQKPRGFAPDSRERRCRQELLALLVVLAVSNVQGTPQNILGVTKKTPRVKEPGTHEQYEQWTILQDPSWWFVPNEDLFFQLHPGGFRGRYLNAHLNDSPKELPQEISHQYEPRKIGETGWACAIVGRLVRGSWMIAFLGTRQHTVGLLRVIPLLPVKPSSTRIPSKTGHPPFHGFVSK